MGVPGFQGNDGVPVSEPETHLNVHLNVRLC